jgi:hypothetical protein
MTGEILKWLSSFRIPVIDNPDDSGIDGWLDRMKWVARFLAAYEKDLLPDTGAHAIDDNQRPAGRFPLRGERLNHEQLGAREVRVLPGRHDVADDTSQLHG